MYFDRIILSSDDNPKFIEFWPLVAQSWRRFFGDIKVWLALVAPAGRFDLAELRKHGYVVRYDPVPGIPAGNQAKVARYFLAAEWDDASVNMTNDLDLMVLQSAYTYNLLLQRPLGHLLTVGAELYAGPEAGKFTAGYLTAESAVWRALVNPLHLDWTDCIRGFTGMCVFDHKEDIARAVHHEDPDTFSDESLLRALLKINPVPVFHAPRGYNPYTARALCRADWKLDPNKLTDGTYVEAHLPRPMHQHADKLKPLIDYLNNG